jgi:hypothetical protein
MGKVHRFMTSYRRTFGLVAASLPLVLAFPVRQAAAFQGVPSATATAAVQVQGTVVLDNNGAAVSGVTVTLVQISATPRATALNPINSGTVTVTPISGGAASGASTAATIVTTTTASDGSFSAAGLATGQFAVCVKDPTAARHRRLRRTRSVYSVAAVLHVPP